MEYEKLSEDGKRYTWNSGESLEELRQLERIAEIKAEYQRRLAAARARTPKNATLIEALDRERLLEPVPDLTEWGPCEVCR